MSFEYKLIGDVLQYICKCVVILSTTPVKHGIMRTYFMNLPLEKAAKLFSSCRKKPCPFVVPQTLFESWTFLIKFCN